MWRSHRPAPDSPGSCVLQTAGGRLVAIARGSLLVWWVEGVGFRPWTRGHHLGGGLAALAYAAAPDRVFALDAAGDLWQAPEGGVPTTISGAHRAPATGEVGLIWDPAGRRLLLASSDGDCTWAFDGQWRELHGDLAAGEGPLRMVGTEAGVFAWRRSCLFGLDGDRWELLLEDAPDARYGLLYDPRRRLLVFAGDDVVALDADGRPVWLGHAALEDPRDAIGLDPVGDRVVCLDAAGLRELSLGSVDGLLPVR